MQQVMGNLATHSQRFKRPILVKYCWNTTKLITISSKGITLISNRFLIISLNSLYSVEVTPQWQVLELTSWNNGTCHPDLLWRCCNIDYHTVISVWSIFSSFQITFALTVPVDNVSQYWWPPHTRAKNVLFSTCNTWHFAWICFAQGIQYIITW